MSKSFSELIREVRASIREVGTDEAARLIEAGGVPVDVRESDEWQEGHLPGAVHVPRGFLESRIEAFLPERDRPLVLYCAGGTRSALAARQLAELGYREVVSMEGGFQQWKSEGRPWQKPVVLEPAQQQRYSRHLLMPEVGAEGQARLLASKVLFIGAGGLGSPGLLYLAAAGVGTLGIVDFDVVDLSNLQRQVIHTSDRIGQKKTDSAATSIRALNPDVNVVAHEEMLTEENVERLIAGYDVVIDGTDTFETRYTLNDAAVRAGIPVVHASVFRFEGQLTVFRPFEGPCYRCLYPTPPPPELAPGCSVAGVLGLVPGTLGLLQATEAIKVLLGIGDPLAGRLLIWDALDGTFTELKLRRDPDCPACGTRAEAALRGTGESAGRVPASVAEA
ncbi:MAG TPA: molybdopterin-synthase adenylyltransferase MoeB [Candidatus Limnocylindrales bacterium]|nr:molybdopterin-synthase adenylyltransferase MoeB [Candidatus Limnocylindrales bacterium]